jgi:hypothetical protein
MEDAVLELDRCKIVGHGRNTKGRLDYDNSNSIFLNGINYLSFSESSAKPLRSTIAIGPTMERTSRNEKPTNANNNSHQ